MATKSAHFFKIAFIIFLNIVVIGVYTKFLTFETSDVLSKVGSRGTEVSAIQQAVITSYSIHYTKLYEHKK